MSAKKVLVTGGSGSVGGFVAEILLSKGYDVVILDRQEPELSLLENKNLRVIIGDITNPSTVRHAMQGAYAVINTAAIVDIAGSFNSLRGVNYDAVKILHNEAKQAGVEYLLHFSTGSVYKPSTTMHNESSAVELSNPYITTKFISEEYLLAKGDSKPVVNIIRPALIYGPRIKVLASMLATLPVLLGMFTHYLPKISGGIKTNWVYSEDVALAAVFLMENPQKHGEIFNVANDDPASLGEMFNEACKFYGLKQVNIEIPFSSEKLVGFINPVKGLVLMGLNGLTSSLWKISNDQNKIKTPLSPSIDMEALDFASQDTIFDNAKIKALGFQFKYPTFISGWVKTVEWYEKKGWIPLHKDRTQKTTEVSFFENMYGKYSLLNDKDLSKDFNFSCTANISSLVNFLGDFTADIEGKVTMDELASDSKLIGKLVINPFLKKELVYDFSFKGDDGSEYTFHGKKKIDFLKMKKSMTTLSGFIYKDSTLFAKAKLHFKLDELPEFLASFKLQTHEQLNPKVPKARVFNDNISENIKLHSTAS